ncbi:TPA: prephenate dehydrogenase [Stenotrophomonas maltophilia]|nr:prephenate dehydrogenase [Stenotrophomonas maltophilia]HDS1026700.1 prephenate dehydrogenase [Stenotrophomonas maltophilia]HDS1032282.1 prephenate dehydrogenase [Stenotrophomonas maltophilia]HDS1035506.1 prephenate dehydrogenase [Stenotrophomonas maltophilia]
MNAAGARTPRTVGIVGSAGAYGRWLSRFFREHMQLQVIGHDPADPQSHTPEQLLEQADVLVFSAPIRHTPALIADYVRQSAGREQDRLWLDVTSVKDAPVQAMLASQAEVVGLHPMTAPPKAPTLNGRVMVVCEARLQHWQPWVDALCAALQAECVRATPQHHDQMMALVQAMVHATHLAQAGVLREYQPQLGDLAAMMPYRSASFELDTAIISRILSLNPAIYEDIQFGNPYVAPMLDRLVGQLQRLQAQVGQGDDVARGQFRDQLLAANHAAFGEPALAAGNYTFERVGYLLADLTERNALSVHLPEDRPGSLRELLNVFEQHRISLASIHSSRTPGGEVHFRIGFVAGSDTSAIAAAAADVDASGIGRVLG